MTASAESAFNKTQKDGLVLNKTRVDAHVQTMPDETTPETLRGGFDQPPQKLENPSKEEAARIAAISEEDEEEKLAQIALLQRRIIGDKGDKKVIRSDKEVIRSRQVTAITSEEVAAGLAARGMRMAEDGTIEKIPTVEEALAQKLRERSERESEGRKAAQELPDQFSEEDIATGLQNLTESTPVQKLPTRSRVQRAYQASRQEPPAAAAE